MSNPLQFYRMIQYAMVLFFLMLPACTSAQTQTDEHTDRTVSSISGDTFQIRRRPTYIDQKIDEMLKMRMAGAQMREKAPGAKRIFFTTPEESGHAFSIGDTRDGYMINGRPLPTPSTLIRQHPVQYERGLIYGTQNLITVLNDTAKAMHKKYPKTIMYMGNMGAREGGDIPYSVSHNSGRDADIGFYYTDDKGRFVHPGHLYKVNRQLQTRTEEGQILTFDLEKNTTLVETLLTHPKIHLQFIFLVKHLRTAIQKELVRRGASEELLNRFEQTVQVQAAHNDHFHIRIYCSNEDICAGCVDKSIIHEWQEDPLPKRDKCINGHLKTLGSKKTDSAHKAAALQRLALMGAAAEHGSKVLKFLDDSDPTVRSAAALAARSLDSSAPKALADRLAKEDQPAVRNMIIQSLAAFDGEKARETFIGLMSAGTFLDETQNFDVIMKYITTHPHEAYVRTLGTLLGKTDRSDQTDAVLLALGTVANRDFCHKTTDMQQCRTNAGQWIEHNAEKPRQVWLISGFNAAGYKVKNIDNASIPALLDAIDGPRPVSINAQLLLKKIGHLEQNSLDWSVDDARWHYTRYFKRRTKKYKINLDDRDEHGIKVKK